MEINPKFKVGDTVYSPLYTTIEKYVIREVLGIEYRSRCKEQPILITYAVTGKFNGELLKHEHELCSSREEALNVIANNHLEGMPSELKEIILNKLKKEFEKP